jgi:hypothetical protein
MPVAIALGAAFNRGVGWNGIGAGIAFIGMLKMTGTRGWSLPAT